MAAEGAPDAAHPELAGVGRRNARELIHHSGRSANERCGLHIMICSDSWVASAFWRRLHAAERCSRWYFAERHRWVAQLRCSVGKRITVQRQPGQPVGRLTFADLRARMWSVTALFTSQHCETAADEMLQSTVLLERLHMATALSANWLCRRGCLRCGCPTRCGLPAPFSRATASSEATWRLLAGSTAGSGQAV